jgi:cytosine/adenosine deaminase-related metal-dependent hydrolase
MSSWTLTARWIIPVDGPPLERGTITFAGERIEAVEPHGRRSADRDLGNVAILPGLVNAHTHLDLTGLRGRCPPSPDFTGWLRQVIQHRRGTTPEQVQADIRAGLAESLRFGTTLLGDIAAQGSSWPVLIQAAIRAVVFLELLGLTADRARGAASQAKEWLASHQASLTCRPGLSPHAPYSVRSSLFTRAYALAKKWRIPLATHVAESNAEVELLRHRRGPFVSFLSDLGVWDRKGLVPSVAHVVQICGWAEEVPSLFVHANYLAPYWTGPSGGRRFVYCPRTHAAFGHPPHPFREFLARGVRVALGTDSLASNPDLDVLAEARFVHRKHPDVPGATLLRMATLSGAEALGWADETGSLTPGKSADLVVLPLPDEDAADPYELVLGSDLPVREVLFRGAWRVEGEPRA